MYAASGTEDKIELPELPAWKTDAEAASVAEDSIELPESAARAAREEASFEAEGITELAELVAEDAAPEAACEADDIEEPILYLASSQYLSETQRILRVSVVASADEYLSL